MSDETEDTLARGQQRGPHGRQQDEGVLVIRTIAMPAGTNPSGDIFGGWLMSQMDLAAGNMAGRVCPEIKSPHGCQLDLTGAEYSKWSCAPSMRLI